MSDRLLELLAQGLFNLRSDAVLLGKLSAEEIGLRVFVHLNLELLSVHADVDADAVFTFFIFFLRARLDSRILEIVVGDSQLRLRGNRSGNSRRYL